MGCDIHLFAEAKLKKTTIEKLMFWKKSNWETLDNWEMDEDWEPPRMSVHYKKRFYTHGRSYNLFAALCGVRRSHFKDHPPRISEPRGIPADSCKEILNEVKEYGSDGHSHNWNTLKELKEFDWSSYGETCDEFIDEVIPKLETYNDGTGESVRIVYFFDN